MINTIQSLIFNSDSGDIHLNDIYIPINTPFPEFKIKLLKAGISFVDQGHSLILNCYEEFINPRKILKIHPTKKLSKHFKVCVKDNVLHLAQVLELDIKLGLNFNSSSKLASIFIKITDRNEDSSSWETYDIGKCHKTHLDWLNQKIKPSKKIDSCPNLGWLTGHLIQDKSENIYWSLKIRQKNRE